MYCVALPQSDEENLMPRYFRSNYDALMYVKTKGTQIKKQQTGQDMVKLKICSV